MWIWLALALAADPPRIVDRPIPFDGERVALTVAYLREHYGIDEEKPTIVPTAIVLHWTAGPTLDNALATFRGTLLKGRPEIARGSPLNVSSQFVVDRDGTIYRLMPETTMARHTIGMNWDAIGVENVGGGPKWPLTAAQVDSDAALVRWLAGEFPITMLLGHYEYRKLEGTPYFRESDADYRTDKPDPGADFMQKVREKVGDLGLAHP
jgi:N-acetyl-anhydromuramyl-L-alanine amidase AmpD